MLAVLPALSHGPTRGAFHPVRGVYAQLLSLATGSSETDSPLPPTTAIMADFAAPLKEVLGHSEAGERSCSPLKRETCIPDGAVRVARIGNHRRISRMDEGVAQDVPSPGYIGSSASE